MIENIAPFDWHNIATKNDLNTLAVVIGAEFTAVRGEFAEQIGEVHKEIGALHVAVSESSQKTSDKLDSMRRWVLGSVVTVVGAVVGSGVWLG